ncbi:hypothetical protein [Paenibacillus sp. FJAT-26967]|uniref:hypothetical protein n=1 Tax=Paenibacillus sp. FJAT-26967 TaxID=1729690 RepID=UPI0008392715|nr:hypothetical protein [Paenibacillus sp. FJAT-26967]
MKVIRRTVITLLILALLLALAGWGLLTYIKPQQPLNLNYKEISLESQAIDLLRTKKPEVRLSEYEINQLGKKGIAEATLPNPDVKITGAEFRLNGQDLTANVNLVWKDRVPVGAAMLFKLDWTGSQLRVTHTGTKIRDIDVPLSLVTVSPIDLPLESYLPRAVHISGVRFDPAYVIIGLTLL